MTIFHVSILVFLEPPLIPQISWGLEIHLSRFNPCFSGTTTYTCNFQASSFASVSFNPCFSGTTTYTKMSWRKDVLLRSFNPCFSGTTTYTPQTMRVLIKETKFQSLFFWNHHLYPHPRFFQLIAWPSFNPCFSGTTTYTSQAFFSPPWPG